MAEANRKQDMNSSASPLMIGLIGTLIALAVTVHAVHAGSPFYGSSLHLPANLTLN